MKSKFLHILCSIRCFFKAIITWLLKKIKLKRSDQSIEVSIDLNNDDISDIAVTIITDREMEE